MKRSLFVVMAGLTTDELEVINSGVGAFNLANLKARELEVSCSGVGSITLSGQADEADYSCSGVGHPAKKDLHHSMTGGISEL